VGEVGWVRIGEEQSRAGQDYSVSVSEIMDGTVLDWKIKTKKRKN
jgi:hypothetical protein